MSSLDDTFDPYRRKHLTVILILNDSEGLISKPVSGSPDSNNAAVRASNFNINGARADSSLLELGSGTAGLPIFELDHDELGSIFRVEFIRRRNVGLSYVAKRSESLAPGSFQSMTGVENSVLIDEHWERVTIERQIDPSVTPQMFGVVEVSIAP